MYESFGFQVDKQGNQSITLFIPDNTVDPTQYTNGGPSGISQIKIVSDFQQTLAKSATNWDAATGLPMVKNKHKNGWLWTYAFPEALATGFYQYLFAAEFESGAARTVGDPCSKYGGTSLDRSGFVVGGTPISATPIKNRLAVNDLMIYEVMIDDFTAGFRTGTPIDAVTEKLDYVASLGVNAVEFMPLTAWPDDTGFSWGYNPAFFFSVESSYVNDDGNLVDRLSRVANMVSECHDRGLHVLLDIVLQHTYQGDGTNGFPYYWLWQDPSQSPFIGDFIQANNFGMLALNYTNNCTQQFVGDVCTYWLQTFKMDGLRFDEVTGFTNPADYCKGAPQVIRNLNTWLAKQKLSNVSLILEDSWGYDAVGHTNAMNASGCWFDMFRSAPFETFSGYVQTGQMSADYMRTLNSAYQFNFPISPVDYIENHDHSTVTYLVGGRQNWTATQPYAIALATCPGAVLIHNGQEWGQVEMLYENDPGNQRVQPRPLTWSESTDATGVQMRSVYSMLLKLRQDHPGLRSPNFYPDTYDESWNDFNAEGYGIDVGAKIVIYHRFGPAANGSTEYFIVALNFTGSDQSVNIPFPSNGTWTDLINNNQTAVVTNNWLTGWNVPSNWGCVFYLAGS